MSIKILHNVSPTKNSHRIIDQIENANFFPDELVRQTKQESDSTNWSVKYTLINASHSGQHQRS